MKKVIFVNNMILSRYLLIALNFLFVHNILTDFA
jgi:hypothetical protein